MVLNQNIPPVFWAKQWFMCHDEEKNTAVEIKVLG